jgi:hypothetical protein
MIPEPQRSYVLELLKALGPAADEFSVAGAQAMKFILEGARATKEIDFLLDVVCLRGEGVSIAAKLQELRYQVVEGSQNFQFEKGIPGTAETIRIEFMAPEEFKRAGDFRVDVEKGVHARACTGGSIALAESTICPISGRLPDGSTFETSIRVTKPHALVMLKLLALDERYRNIRGLAEARHDREEARVHVADVIAVIGAQLDRNKFKGDFERQFHTDAVLGLRVLKILDAYFRDSTSSGLLLYEEFIVADKPLDRDARREVRQQLVRAHGLMLGLVPVKSFYELLATAGDCCDFERNLRLVEEFLANLQDSGIDISDSAALQCLPATAFGGAFAKGATFTVNASEALRTLSAIEIRLLHAHLQLCAEGLRGRADFVQRFPRALGRKAEAI